MLKILSDSKYATETIFNLTCHKTANLLNKIFPLNLIFKWLNGEVQVSLLVYEQHPYTAPAE